MIQLCCINWESAKKRAALEWLDEMIMDIQDIEMQYGGACWGSDLLTKMKKLRKKKTTWNNEWLVEY